MKSRRSLILICAVVVGLTDVAMAGPAAESRFHRGLERYQQGDFEGAARELARAHELDAKPEYLFAWAQAERMSGECERAIELFEDFLEVAATEEDADAAMQAMEGCEEAGGELIEPPAQPEPEPEPQPEPEPAPPTPTPGSATTVQRAVTRPRPASSLRWGIAIRADADATARGAVVAPGVMIQGTTWEAFGNGLVGNNRGLELGVRASLRPLGPVAPYLSGSVPVFFIDDEYHVNLRGAVGARWRATDRWAVTLEGGVARATSAPHGVARSAALVSLGFELWN